MPDRKPGPSVKKPDTYESLVDKGESKEKAARIANAQANTEQAPSKKGGRADRYEDRSKDDLYAVAQEVGIEGRSEMTKDELIAALRNR